MKLARASRPMPQGQLTDQVLLGAGELSDLCRRDAFISVLFLKQEWKYIQVDDRAKRSILRRLCAVRSPVKQSK